MVQPVKVLPGNGVLAGTAYLELVTCETVALVYRESALHTNILLHADAVDK